MRILGVIEASILIAQDSFILLSNSSSAIRPHYDGTYFDIVFDHKWHRLPPFYNSDLFITIQILSLCCAFINCINYVATHYSRPTRLFILAMASFF